MNTKQELEKSHFFYCYNIIFKMDISPYAKLVYTYLCRCADSRGKCYPSMENIGDACGIKSRTTVNSALKELLIVGLLEKNSRKRIGGGNSSNEYFIQNKPKI